MTTSTLELLAAGILLGTITVPAAALPVYSPLTGSYYDYVNRDIADRAYRTWTWEEARADAEARSYMGRPGHVARRLPGAGVGSGHRMAMGDGRSVRPHELGVG